MTVRKHSLPRLEMQVAVLLTLLLAAIHVRLAASAGPLWRDEVNSVNIAHAGSLAETWRAQEFDSFPVLFHLVLRAWTLAGGGGADAGYRAFGALVGLGLLAVLWRNARARGGTPLLALALLGCNAAAVCFGDGVRGYGLGLLLELLAIRLVWEYASAPSGRRLAAAGLAALASVHALFQNVVPLGAACGAALLIALLRGRRRAAVGVAGIGLAALASLAVYAGVFARQREWGAILERSLGASWTLGKLVESARLSGPVAPWLWLALAGGGLLCAVAALARRREDAAPIAGDRDFLLYETLLFVGGTGAFLAFLWRLGYHMQPWYFLPLYGLLAEFADGAGAALAGASRRPRALVAAGALLALAAAPALVAETGARATSVDRVAAQVAAGAAAEDLVVVMPWQTGISFARYYDGAAPWETMPPLAAHDVHRFDLLRAAMMSPDDVRPLLARIEATLAGGHRVWWVGDLPLPARGEAVRPPPPAPQAPWGWREEPYYRAWGLQASALMLSLDARGRKVATPLGGAVRPFENPSLVVVARRAAR